MKVIGWGNAHRRNLESSEGSGRAGCSRTHTAELVWCQPDPTEGSGECLELQLSHLEAMEPAFAPNYPSVTSYRLSPRGA